ncbi:MAG: DUF192 domain-containing protein [Pseudomonadota bacterium]
MCAAIILLALPGETRARACEADAVEVAGADAMVRYGVEIADDPEEQSRGLMFRSELGADRGMLFLFDSPRQAQFWMRNTLIPLDILFVGADGAVLNIAERTVPFSEEILPSDGLALAVLEVNAGEAEKHGFGPGSQVVHPFFSEAPEAYRCTDTVE